MRMTRDHYSLSNEMRQKIAKSEFSIEFELPTARSREQFVEKLHGEKCSTDFDVLIIPNNEVILHNFIVNFVREKQQILICEQHFACRFSIHASRLPFQNVPSDLR